MKIVLVGHAFGPDCGSEDGLTWNWAWHLSEHEDVWVLAHPEHRSAVESRLREVSRPRLHIRWVNLPSWRDPYRPERGERWIRLHYTFWQWAVLRETRQLCCEINVDIIHHVSLGTVSVPSRLWQLGVPFVWGPLGGGQTTPWRFLRYFGRNWFRELLRNLYVTSLRFRSDLRRAARKSSLVMATNKETAAILGEAGAQQVMMLVDNGISPKLFPPAAPVREPKTVVQFLWAGRVEPRKGLLLALEAFAAAGPDLSARLVIAGKGTDLKRCEAAAKRLGLGDRVTFLGWVSWQRMPELFLQSDAFLFTSIQDSFGSVLLEAMSNGLPIIAIDHQGVGACIPKSASIKVPPTTPSTTREGIAAALRQMTGSYALRQRMGVAAWEFAQTQSWDRRATSMLELYSQLRKTSVTTFCRSETQRNSPTHVA